MTSALEQSFHLAMQHHHAGRLPQAEALYREILAADPNHADTLHLMGVLASQQRRPDAAIELMRRAIAVKPGVANYHIDLGNAYQVAGRLDDAVASYRRALELKLDIAEVHSNLGIVLHAKGEFEDAVASHRRAIDLKPHYAEAHNNLGNVLRDLRRLDDAIASYERALSLKPNYVKAMSNLGVAYLDRDRIDEALALHERAVALAPNSAEAHCNLGNALRAKGRFEDAVVAHNRALAINPNLAEAHNNLGAAYHDLGRLDDAIASCERALQLKPRYPQALVNLIASLDRKGRTADAIACYRRAIEIEPNLAAAHSNLCTALCNAGLYDESIASGRRAIELQPGFADAHNNLGPPLCQKGQFAETIACYERAIALKPDYALAHFNLGLMYLLHGDFTRGWAEVEWRWQTPSVSKLRRPLSQPTWEGSPLAGRTLFLHYEWGLGDTMNLVRYVDAIDGRVIVECQSSLLRLLRQSFPKCTWITEHDPLPPIDVHCGLVDLPRIFGAPYGDRPGNRPYLTADPNDVEAWCHRLAGDSRPLKVGVAWAGSPIHKNDRNRSLTPTALTPLMDVPGVSLYSLQKGAAPQTALEVVDWTRELHDFADTAALIANLDLVISVDTSVVHLTGGMGKPVWTMLPFSPDWRWLLDRDDTPWYPSMRLFRQPTLGDWASVVSKVVEALRCFARQGADRP